MQYAEHQTEYTDLFDKDSSHQNYEEDVQLTGFGLAPVKAEGAGVAYDSEIQGFTTRYTHVAYALGYIVTKEELDDNLYESVSKRRAAALAMSFRQTKENIGANIYNRAFTTGYVGGDGVTLINTAHPVANGLTYSNQLTTPAALSQTSVEQMLIQIRSAVDNNGKRIRLKAEQLVVPPALEFQAEVILKSVLRSGTADNDLNPIKSTGMLPKGTHVVTRLSSSKAWWIQTDAENGLMLVMRRPMEKSMEGDFETDSMRYKATERYATGWHDARNVYGTAGV